MGDSQPRRIEERIARELLLAASLLLVAVAQAALLPRPLGFPPNVMLMLVICQSLIAGVSRASRWAFYGGLALDLCSGRLIGTHALALLVAVFAASLPLGRLSRENWLLPLFGALFGAFGFYVALGLLTYVFDGAFDVRSFLLVAALPDALLTLIPALPMFLVWRAWLSRRRGEVPVDVY